MMIFIMKSFFFFGGFVFNCGYPTECAPDTRLMCRVFMCCGFITKLQSSVSSSFGWLNLQLHLNLIYLWLYLWTSTTKRHARAQACMRRMSTYIEHMALLYVAMLLRSSDWHCYFFASLVFFAVVVGFIRMPTSKSAYKIRRHMRCACSLWTSTEIIRKQTIHIDVCLLSVHTATTECVCAREPWVLAIRLPTSRRNEYFRKAPADTAYGVLKHRRKHGKTKAPVWIADVEIKIKYLISLEWRHVFSFISYYFICSHCNYALTRIVAPTGFFFSSCFSESLLLRHRYLPEQWRTLKTIQPRTIAYFKFSRMCNNFGCFILRSGLWLCHILHRHRVMFTVHSQRQPHIFRHCWVLKFM